MKLKNRSRKKPHQSGQVLAEACLGLALLTFTWILFSFTGYMTNNHIRTAMAARHAAWLNGHGVTPAKDNIADRFFLGNDIALVQVTAPVSHPLSTTGLSVPHDGDNIFSGWVTSDTASTVTVKFGLEVAEVKKTGRYPFTLMNTQVPFMTNSMLAGYTMVESHCAWMDGADNTWTSFSDAMSGLVHVIVNMAGSLIGGIASYF